jgi:hypothetical protein
MTRPNGKRCSVKTKTIDPPSEFKKQKAFRAALEVEVLRVAEQFKRKPHQVRNVLERIAADV